MENFQKLKDVILKRAKERSAYVHIYKRVCESENMEQLCKVIKDDFWSACKNGVLYGEMIEQYKEAFAANKIYSNTSVSEGFVLAWGNATVEASGNATVEASGNATVAAGTSARFNTRIRN